ncbi:MAG: outer membrane protein [Flavobacteriales bacterium]|jgi:outer membrane protein
MNSLMTTLKFCSVATIGLLIGAHVNAEGLLDIYEDALQNDHQFKAAHAGYLAGKEDINISRAGLLPNISGTANWSDSSTENSGTSPFTPAPTLANHEPVTVPNSPFSSESDTTTSGYSVTLSQPLFNMAVWHAYKAGKATSNIAQAQYEADKQALIIRSARAYFNTLKAVDNLETSQAEENALKHQLEQTQQRFEVGLTAITEVHEAQAVYDSALADKLIARGQLGIDFEALEVITGQSYQELLPLKENFPVTPPDPISRMEWERQAVANNHQLRAASLRAESFRQNAKASRAAHLPTLTGNFTLSSNNSENVSNGNSLFGSNTDSDTTSIGVTLSVPLFAGGGTSASRRRTNQQYIQQRENFLQTQRDTIQQVRSQHLSIETSVAIVKARKQAIKSNESALEATKAGYDVGTRDLVDVLNAQRNLFRAKRDYLNALYDYILSSLELKSTAGLLGDGSLNDLNQWLDGDQPIRKVSF